MFICQGGGYEPALAINGFGSNEDSSSPPESPLLGFATDGRRLYGPYDATRSLAWGLDVCNGRWEVDGLHSGSASATADQKNRQYSYRATPSFPYLIGCRGPAGVTVAATEAAADAADGDDHSKIGDGFLLVEASPGGGCPAGSFLATGSGECEACRAGTYGKSVGHVGVECQGVSEQLRTWLPSGCAERTSRTFFCLLQVARRAVTGYTHILDTVLGYTNVFSNVVALLPLVVRDYRAR